MKKSRFFFYILSFWFRSCISFFSPCCDKIPWQKQLKREGLLVDHSVKAQLIMVGSHGNRSLWQLNATCPHLGQRETCIWVFCHLLLFIQTRIHHRMTMLQLWWVFPPPVAKSKLFLTSILRVCLQGDSNPSKLTVSTIHHRRTSWYQENCSDFKSHRIYPFHGEIKK